MSRALCRSAAAFPTAELAEYPRDSRVITGDRDLSKVFEVFGLVHRVINNERALRQIVREVRTPVLPQENVWGETRVCVWEREETGRFLATRLRQRHFWFSRYSFWLGALFPPSSNLSLCICFFLLYLCLYLYLSTFLSILSFFFLSLFFLSLTGSTRLLRWRRLVRWDANDTEKSQRRDRRRRLRWDCESAGKRDTSSLPS